MRCKQTKFLFLEKELRSPQRKVVCSPYVEIKVLKSVTGNHFLILHVEHNLKYN